MQFVGGSLHVCILPLLEGYIVGKGLDYLIDDKRELLGIFGSGGKPFYGLKFVCR